jgi:fumarate hydratase class I
VANDLFPLGPDTTPWKKLTDKHVSVEEFRGQEILTVDVDGLRLLAEAAFGDINHLLRPGHLKQLAAILDDPEATENDRFVAFDLLKNANIAAGGVLPMCQDTGTAIIMAKKGRKVWTEGGDYEALAGGVMDAYERRNLRYSQLAPLSMFEEKNTKTNLPAQIDIYEEGEDSYDFLFVAKGGGSANKTFLYQGTPSLLTHDRMIEFLREKILTLGTAACPPYHLAIVIGGTSAEMNLKTVKLASTRYLDELPTSGSDAGHAFRDLEMEAEVHKLTQQMGVGAQFGGKYFCHDVRVIRLPRHGASLPIGLGVSCSADRQAKGKITRDGIFLEQLETDPSKYLPEIDEEKLSEHVVKIDLNQPMADILAELAKHPIKTQACRSPAQSSLPATWHTRKSVPGLRPAKRCPIISRTTLSIMPARPRRPKAMPRAPSARRPRAGWIPMSISSSPLAAQWSCLPRATAPARCAKPVPGMAASTSVRSAARRPAWRRIASRMSRSSSTLNWVWKRSGGSRWKISRHSSSSTTRATISSRN